MNFKHVFRKFITKIYWSSKFGSIGRKTVIYKPIFIANSKKIFVGENSIIRDHARLEVVVRHGVKEDPMLSIGNNVNIEQGVHIVCNNKIVIEDNVSITPYCVIVDTDHPFDEPDQLPKIGDRINLDNKPVRIGRGSFIGAHSIILPGVSIGQGCVIGAGSVVSQDIPNYALAVGQPARIIKRFDLKNRKWDKVICE